LGDLVTDWVLV